VISMLAIFIASFVPNHVASKRLAESEVGLQIAGRALRNQVELLRAMPLEKLTQNRVMPFDSRGKSLEQLVAGRGVVLVKQDPEYPGMVLLRLEVHWRDPRIGMRSIHTVLLRSS